MFEFRVPKVYCFAMEKTWEVKEKEVREEIAKNLIKFLEDNEWYNDEQLTAVVMGEK